MRARLHDMLLGMARHDLTDVCRLFALERLLFFSNPGHSSSARHGAQEECRYGNTSHHAAVLPFVLHGAGWSAAQELMAEALESAPVLLVLDYRQPCGWQQKRSGYMATPGIVSPGVNSWIVEVLKHLCAARRCAAFLCAEAQQVLCLWRRLHPLDECGIGHN